MGHEKLQSDSGVSELTDDEACDCVSNHKVFASVSAALKASSAGRVRTSVRLRPFLSTTHDSGGYYLRNGRSVPESGCCGGGGGGADGGPGGSGSWRGTCRTC